MGTKIIHLGNGLRPCRNVDRRSFCENFLDKNYACRACFGRRHAILLYPEGTPEWCKPVRICHGSPGKTHSVVALARHSVRVTWQSVLQIRQARSCPSTLPISPAPPVSPPYPFSPPGPTQEGQPSARDYYLNSRINLSYSEWEPIQYQMMASSSRTPTAR
jgi:hypothetical protein